MGNSSNSSSTMILVVVAIVGCVLCIGSAIGGYFLWKNMSGNGSVSDKILYSNGTAVGETRYNGCVYTVAANPLTPDSSKVCAPGYFVTKSNNPTLRCALNIPCRDTLNAKLSNPTQGTVS